MKLIKSIILSLVLIAGFAPASFAQDAPHAQIRVLPERSAVTPGDTIFVIIEQAIEPGWHTYWVNPGDSGEAMTIEWDMPPGFEAGNIRWPAPVKIMTGPLASYGYHDRAVILQELGIPEDLPEGPVTLKATVDLLVCAEICIPESSTHEVVLNGPEQDNATLAGEAYEALPMAIDWPATYREENGEFVLALELFQRTYLDHLEYEAAFTIMPEDWGLVDNAASAAAELGDTLLVLKQKRGDRPLKDMDKVVVLVSYGNPGQPVQTMQITAIPDRAWKETLLAAPAKPDAVPPEGANIKVKRVNSQSGDKIITQEDISGWEAVIFAFIGGLILNLMPCVFPILSLKALKLCRLSGQELAQAKAHSLLYVGGILAAFTVFALVLTGLRDAGEMVGWGFQLQNPLFVLLLSWLLFTVGLNMAGYFEFGGALANLGHRFVQGHGYATSFLTGVLAALVATPCTAPFMAAALGYAITQSTGMTLAIFFALGFGLGFPYLLLAFVPALRAALPKPGVWMETFRQFLSFPLFAAAAWLVWVFSMQGGALNNILALSGAILITFAFWTGKGIPAHGLPRLLRIGAGILALIALLGIVCVTARQEEPLLRTVVPQEGWTPYLRDEFAKLEAGDAPLFVNMTASWCITCKVNERVALDTDEVKALFAKHNVVTVRGDWTNNNPEISEYLLWFGRNGVPLYVYYGPRGADGKRPEPVVLPQILTPGIVADAIGG